MFRLAHSKGPNPEKGDAEATPRRPLHPKISTEGRRFFPSSAGLMASRPAMHRIAMPAFCLPAFCLPAFCSPAFCLPAFCLPACSLACAPCAPACLLACLLAFCLLACFWIGSARCISYKIFYATAPAHEQETAKDAERPSRSSQAVVDEMTEEAWRGTYKSENMQLPLQ